MDKFNPRKSLLIGVLIVGVLALALGVAVTPAAAYGNAVPKADCEGKGGTWSGVNDTGHCSNATGSWLSYCPAGATSYSVDTYFNYPSGWTWDLGNIVCHFSAPGAPSATPAPLNYGMERKGLCKLASIEDGYLGGNLTAVVRGKPVNLKLKADGKTYVLPLVPGSVVSNGDGTYTAQFYTFDPTTGQALVPAGEYGVRCHGGSGSNDGSGNTVSIGY